MKMKKRGFTIVELIIVIAVIAILAAVLIPTFVNVTKSAKESKALMEAKSGWDDYLATTNGILPNKTDFILYRNNGMEMVFRVNGASFDGLATEEEVANLKAKNPKGTLDGAFCGYEYDAGTQRMMNYHPKDSTSNTTKWEAAIIGG